MVMGIFMCSALVGALWYLAGVGDAILLRERAQEAADAVAFSDAALHARGMNLIVLVNIVMACILGVRVALKIAQIVLTIAAAVFAGLGFFFPVLWAAVGPCLAGAQILEQLISSTRTPINEGIRALGVAQDAVSVVTPTAARAGALMIGAKYEPTIARVGLTHFGSDTHLPIADGSQDKLCGEAGHAAGYISGWVLNKGTLGLVPKKASDKLGGMFEAIAGMSPRHFCEIGSATGNVDTDGFFDEAAGARCDADPQKIYDAWDDAEVLWEKKCAELGVTCAGRDDKGLPANPKQTGTTTPEGQAELDRLRLVRDQEQRALKEFIQNAGDLVGPMNRESCIDWAKKDMRRRMGEQEKLASSQGGKTSTGAKSNITAKKVDDGFRNGGKSGQVAAGAALDERRLAPSSRLVRVGAFKPHAGVSAPEAAALPSWAQAEFFFDCAGRWDQCNDDEDAMWHLSWRARLRRWNEPEPLDRAILEMGFVGGPRIDLPAFASQAETTPGLFVPSPELRADLERALRATRRRGAH